MNVPYGPHKSSAVLLLISLFVIQTSAESVITPSEIIAAVRGMGPRRENTEGERVLLGFIAAEAQKRGLNITAIPISDFSETHSFSSILEVAVPGTGSDTIVLVVPICDSLPWGDGAAGIAAALILMDQFARSPPPLQVRFAFLGADEYLKGSRAYAAYCSDEPSLAAVRIEAVDTGIDFAEILIGGSKALSPYWLYTSVLRSIRSMGIRDVVKANRSMIQRLGLLDEPTPLDPWFQRAVPAVAIRAGLSGSIKADPGTSGIVQILEHLIRSQESGIPDRWDRQYVLFEAWGFRIAIRETLYVASVLILFAVLGLVFVLDSLRNREILREDLSRIPGGARALATVAGVLLVCVFAVGALQQVVLYASGSPEFWKVHPVFFSALRSGQILTLFIALSSFFARIGLLPRKADFFRGSAIVLSGADIFLVSAVRLSLSLLFLWAFIIALLGRRTSRSLRSSWPSALSLPIMLFPLGLLLAELVRSPEQTAFERFLLPGPADTAWIVFLSLPFLMVLVGLGEGLFGPGFYKSRTSWISAGLFLALSSAGGGWLIADALRYPGPTEISVREYSDESAETGRLVIRSRRPLPSFRLSKGTFHIESAPGPSGISLEQVPIDSRIRLSMDTKSFLDRVQLTLSVRTEGESEGISIAIPSVDSGSVYDASFPFRSSEDGKGIVVFIGARPPNPVSVSLTVSRDFAALAEVAADFPAPSVPWNLDGPVRLREYRQISRLYVYLRGGRGPTP